MITKMYISLLLVFLISCNAAETTEANQNKIPVEKQEPSADHTSSESALKTGVYHAYQLSGGGFGFQYKFELMEDGTYTMFDKKGNYRFDPVTNGIHFLSGGIAGYKGVFTRVDHVNNTRKLMIILDFHEDAAIPDTLALDKKPGGYYQYAYFQGE